MHTIRPILPFILAAFLGTTSYPADVRPDTPRNRINEQTRTENVERLAALQESIRALQKTLERTSGERDEERNQLRTLERRISDLIVKLRDFDRQQVKERNKLGKLEKKKDKLGSERDYQLKGLEKTIKTAYLTGKQEYLKLLLNQENPAAISRVLTYHRYLNSSRLDRLRSLETTLSRLTDIETQIAHRAETLATLREKRQAEKQALEITRRQRAQVLTRLNRQVHSQTEEMERLRADEQQLEHLLQELQGILSRDAEIPAIYGRFNKNKGKLSLPTRGKIKARYGTRKNIGDLRWRGVYLSGREGQEIKAVFRGRVAFADWLRGFGLLLILEHGDGYMTLYGHNQSLYKEVGDWVESGQVIARMGNTGEHAEPGLYFEIRHNGKPRDPLLWCRTR